MDFFRFIFAFLMFHRRTLIGILLLVGLYFFFTDILPRIPRPDRAARSPAEGSPNPTDSGTENPADTKPVVTPTRTTDQILRSGNVDELFQELIRLKDLSLQSKTESVSLVIASDILKIARRILELPVTTEQRRFALGVFNESILFMRISDVSAAVADESIDAEFLNITETFVNDPDPRISCYAAFTLIAATVFEFEKNPTQGNLNRMEASIESNLENLSKMPTQVDRVCDLIISIGLPRLTTVDTTEFVSRFTQQLLNHRNQFIKDAGHKFQANWAFGQLDVANLVHKLGDRTPAADQSADEFFKVLDQHPNVGISTYQVGLNIIKEYIQQGRSDRAKKFIVMLETEILPKREDADSRTRIKAALDSLRVYTTPIR